MSVGDHLAGQSLAFVPLERVGLCAIPADDLISDVEDEAITLIQTFPSQRALHAMHDAIVLANHVKTDHDGLVLHLSESTGCAAFEVKYGLEQAFEIGRFVALRLAVLNW